MIITNNLTLMKLPYLKHSFSILLLNKVKCMYLFLEVVVASNNVWQDISSQLNNRMSINALHVFVYKGYHGIKEKLGLTQIKSLDVVLPKNTILSNLDQSSDFEPSDKLDSDLPNKKFVITFCAEEWKEIQPQTVQYKLLDKKRSLQHSKSYEVLPKNRWTPLIAEHFWIHTQLPCCLSFCRAKVSLNGDNYVSVVGRCSVYGSYFKGIVSEKPPDNARVLMQCSYVGNFNEPHKVIKKRRMIGPVIEKALSHIVKEGMSCETYRENEAVRLMKTNDLEPSIIPTGHALRNFKRRQRLNNERNSNKLKALCMMKTENEFKSVINDIGLDPFFLFYHTDATGSVVSNFRKYDMEKTKYIFLYEALVYDEENNYSFTVSNMLSERHSNVAIFNWLTNWKICDIPLPKITVCDQSLALLSAVVQCFTQYSSL
ncbi:uncharacterized protein LOC107883669 [Acyrthosiphon pisum]|uniref:Uncharacterized protein n=1 Tax=Acyrthosiphon pisum TaxID=7029 RepID=A0A8R2NMR0_ACYPI|nr:uncharacterized protein LOC107883669 [Acyrthosiphon pisum]